jgi:hypothetical protein
MVTAAIAAAIISFEAFSMISSPRVGKYSTSYRLAVVGRSQRLMEGTPAGSECIPPT